MDALASIRRDLRRAAAVGAVVGWLTLGVILAGVRRRLGEDDSEVVGHV